jgi:hypothetical protein
MKANGYIIFENEILSTLQGQKAREDKIKKK